MRPLKLKIKGLNSFMDAQEIDFARLTSRGLFGIFGPTGSGKSTILDGITLALYGAVARGSTNYLNTNCDSLNVSFEFQISEKEIKKYRVDREFRRNKKSGHVNTYSAKILQLTEAGEIVLEDQVREVTKKCEEIIGLKLDDFTRTVVLPQGKFSEFLRLEGRERREMLERLFNLQKYGDELSNRLGARVRQEQEKANLLAGELKSYEGCSEEILQEKTKELATLQEKLIQSQAELKKAEEAFQNGKEVWDLQRELSHQEAQRAQLEKRQAEIRESERRANQGERALRVKPYLEQYEDTLGKIATTQEQVAGLAKDTEVLAAKKKEAEARLEQARLQKEKELPSLRLREQNVADALEEKLKLHKLNLEKNTLQAQIQQIKGDLEDKEARIAKGEEFIMQVNKNILDREQRVEDLTIDQEFKKKVNEALFILSHSEEAELQVKSLTAEIKTLKEKHQEAGEKGTSFAKELKTKEELLQDSNLQLQNLVEACPGDQETLILFQEKLNRLKDQWTKHHEYSAAIGKNQESIQELLPKLELIQQRKAQMDQEILELEQEIEKLKREDIAQGLRLALREGEACPVCGSKHHHLEEMAVFDTQNLEKLQTLLSEKRVQAQSLYQDMIKVQEKIKTHEASLSEYGEKMAALGEEYKGYDPAAMQREFDALREAIARYTQQKDQLDEEIKQLSQERNDLAVKLNEQNTIKKEILVQLESRGKALEQVKSKVEAYEKELTTLRDELGVGDFKQQQDEIIHKENEKAKLESELKGYRETLKKAQSRKDQLNHELSSLKEALKENTGILNEKVKAILEKQDTIKAKVGDVEDLEAYQKDLLAKIAQIDENYAQAEKTKNDLEKRYNDSYTRLQSTQSNLQSLLDRSQGDKESLAKALGEEKLSSIEEVKSFLLEKAEIERLKQEVKEYQDSLTQLVGAIENLKKKLGGRSLTQEQWEEIQRFKEEKDLFHKGLEESKITLQSSVKTLVENLHKKQELLKEQSQLERQLGLLKDLEKLFKGKKFVEYVAAHQLKYVSIEASKRLKEITGGNYGLEVDENGKFLIRDYKNGGAERDASTLSGGETFLASLSLALALSAQIQLKGTAPLELFFLDEGFGTLDDQLLEVVMDSLEKIHHDQLSVGIISHVEAIKNRVPVKLMVTPAKAGMGGSKVSIEVS